MDNAEVVSEVQRGESRLHTVDFLTEVDTTDAKLMEDIWNHISQLDYAFDDASEGHPEIWITKCLMPNTKLWLIKGNIGLIQLESIVPRVNAVLHHALWGPLPLELRKKIVHFLQTLVFDKWHLERLTTIVPTSNPIAKRFALSSGFKFEGSIRRAWLKRGVYYDIDLFGILRSEWESRKKVN